MVVMSKYIDAELLRKKVEKLDMESCISEEWSGFYYAIDSVLEVIDSLQQEQPEVDLDNHTIMEEIRKCGCNPNEFDVARHFYELGINARKEE